MSPGLDVAANRSAVKYSLREQARRVAWSLAQPLFRWSPRPAFAWRALLLRLFGAQVGRGVHVYPSTRISMPWNLSVGDWSALGEEVLVYNLGPVSLGERVTVSLRAFLCAGTHDHTKAAFPLQRPPIAIGADAWVAAGALVGPGVTVGAGAVVAAGAVVVADVPPWTIVGGNPAREIGPRELTP